jgi:hypothetical protein
LDYLTPWNHLLGSRPYLLTASFLVALVPILFGFTPGSIEGMGYVHEEMAATRSLLDAGFDLLSGHAPAKPLSWTRQGILPTLYDAPFLLVGRLFPSVELWQDRTLCLQPVLFTSGIGGLFFIWLRRLTGHSLWSLGLSLVTIFCTLLCPTLILASKLLNLSSYYYLRIFPYARIRCVTSGPSCSSAVL